MNNINPNNKALLRSRHNNKLQNSQNNPMTNDYYNNNNEQVPKDDNMKKRENITDILDEDNCFICGIKQEELLPKGKFYLCRECDHLLCNNCKDRHDDVHPNHNVVTNYISGENNNLDDDKQKLRNIPRTKNYDYYNEYKNPSNNNKFYNDKTPYDNYPKYNYGKPQEYLNQNYNNNNSYSQNNQDYPNS